MHRQKNFGAGPDSKPLGTYRTATSTKLTSVYTPVCTMYERTPCAALAALEEPTLPPRRVECGHHAPRPEITLSCQHLTSRRVQALWRAIGTAI